ncbi:MAG: DUF1553 domain-containing protein [Acidobacteria bacterium]|nr:DUF1553 domain-containing protein [Acidobacteriota bacterium]
MARAALCIVFALCPALPAAETKLSPGVDFQRDIRPILSDACFHCHGPDKNTRLMGLRLDTREGAFSERKSGRVIVPGQPKGSLLYQRITHDKEAMRMPPAASHKVLAPQQKDRIRRWIEQGAPWKEHWSFAAPVRPRPPVVSRRSWVRNPIDRFILARLDAEGLAPAPEADRRTLIRRLSFDLTGLPPAPAEVEEFAGDSSAGAYEKLVDRLLESKHWGEHRARYWLDAARYADTHGIHVDNYREMWPYRDWVIQAFNRNLSFDRFTIEQVAGDLLPDRTLDQQVASGFHRCNVTTNEAGVILEEVEAIYAKDRVDTTGAVFLGLTVGCAACHDHKFDPISQKDFYSLGAFFRNTTQPVMDGNSPDTPPMIVVPRVEDRARWSQLSGEEAAIKSRKRQMQASPGPAFEQWLRSETRRAIDAPLEAASEAFSLWSAMPATLPQGVTLGPAETAERKAIHFAKQSSFELPPVADLDADKPFAIAASVYFPVSEDNFVVVSQSDTKDKGRGWVLEIAARVPAFRLNGNGGKAIQVRAGHMEQLKPGSWNHLAVSYDGSREQAGLALYINGKAIPTQGGGDQTVYLEGSISSQAPLRLGRDGTRYFAEGAIAGVRVFRRAISEEDALLASLWPVLDGARDREPEKLTGAEREAFEIHFLSHQDPEYRKLSAQLQSLDAERRGIRRRGAVTLVMQERADSKPMAHILQRGMYDRPGEKVEPNVPSVLPPLPASFPRNRLGLARWLVDPANPLTARVTVNRFWQELFGTGLVRTAEDFGSQGEAPSHAQLLDWLAVDFMESGWDVKKLFKLMVTSAAYRQAAVAAEEKLKKDPDNRLLSRGPRFRMDAETLRDFALAASGLLVPTIGGPSVKPYQPAGVWETVAMVGSNTRFYKQDHGDKLYRRSLYTFWKRSAPPASMDIFNAPTRETCTVRRERTNTPLQALATMNDPQFVEAARHLAQRAVLADAGFDRRLDFMTLRALARPFQSAEREIARRALQDLAAHYATHPEEARKLLAVGESKPDEAVPAPEFAAWTLMASNLLNLDEALNK